MPTLNIHAHLLAFSDPDAGTSQPRFRNVDWAPARSQLPVNTPINRELELAPGETRTVFDGQRVTAIDNTTEFDLTLNLAKPGVYRLSHSGGTAPAFRVSRALTLSGLVVTAAVNNNATMEFSLDAASSSTFAGCVPGDTVFIPDLTTGDTQSPFNVMNTGFWTVLALGPNGIGANRKLTCSRPLGQAFQGVSETVTLTADAEFRAFSSGPVQAGDSLEISAAFSPVTRRTYQVSAVTDDWLEFTSGQSLPLEAGVVPNGGLRIYSDAQSVVYVETDQDATVRINGSAGDHVIAQPQRVNDLDSRSMFLLTGTVWRLDLVNRNVSEPMTALVIGAKVQV